MKRRNEFEHLTIYDYKVAKIIVNDDAYRYIRYLEHMISDLKYDNRTAERALEAIKPVIESGKLTPAVSVQCGDCKYVVRSNYDHSIIGCRKNSVCEDFDKED